MKRKVAILGIVFNKIVITQSKRSQQNERF